MNKNDPLIESYNKTVQTLPPDIFENIKQMTGEEGVRLMGLIFMMLAVNKSDFSGFSFNLNEDVFLVSVTRVNNIIDEHNKFMKKEGRN